MIIGNKTIRLNYGRSIYPYCYILGVDLQTPSPEDWSDCNYLLSIWFIKFFITLETYKNNESI